MKNMTDVINTFDFVSRRQSQETQKELDPVSVDIVNRIFVFFESICRGFENQYHRYPQSKLNMEKIQWARGFMDYGIKNIEQLEFGIKKCRLESPINTPTLGRFLKWCTPDPQDIGLPTLERAYEISIHMNKQFSDYKPTCQKTYSVIRHVINQIGPMEFRSMKAAIAFKTFERYYPIACSQFVEGSLKEIPKAIADKVEEHPSDRPRSNEARLKAMDAIRSLGIPVTVKNE